MQRRLRCRAAVAWTGQSIARRDPSFSPLAEVIFCCFAAADTTLYRDSLDAIHDA